MPKEKDAEEKVSEKTQKKSGGKGLLVVIIMLLLAIIAAGAVLVVFKKGPAAIVQQPFVDSMVQSGSPMQPGGSFASKEDPGPIQTYPAFLVNLADPGGNRYLKLTLALELSRDKNFPNEITAKEPRIKDIIISVLTSKTYDEVSTFQGKISLKQEMMRRLNAIMSNGRITDVYITEFIVQ